MIDVGIIGAMDIEVQGIAAELEACRTERVGGIEFHVGSLRGKSVAVAKCGIGKVFAALCTEAMIVKYAPRLIVNTGVAGAIGDGVAQGDVVVAKSLVQHDMDTSVFGDPLGFISGIGRVFFESDERAAGILLSAAEELGIKAVGGTVATGDCFISSPADKLRLRELFAASACEMEGGAVAQVAFANQTPFAVIRAISDGADEGTAMSYENFLPVAAARSRALTLALVERF